MLSDINSVQKLIQQRSLPAGQPVCEQPLLDRLYRTRQIQQSSQLDRSLKSMLSPNFANLDQALSLLLDALNQQQRIVIVGDFDADGATSTALAVLALRRLGYQNVDYLVPNRFEQGYGLSIAVAEQALAKQVELLITVDNGISSLEGVEFIRAKGVKVLITDHHLPPDRLPNAEAMINPNLTYCPFPSKNLAGVGVTFYLMLALRAKLRDLGLIPTEHLPNFAELLDLVALGTVADVVPLDQNNRILVYQGLARIRAGQCCMGIQALAEIAKRDVSRFTTAELGFVIGPRLNAAGRLDNMSIGVELLLCDNLNQARMLAAELDSLNQERKEIEQGMKAEAIQICQQLQHLQQNLPLGIVLYQADWHQGVLGIVASRLKDQFYRPVIAFTQDQVGVLKGSARSVEGLHIRDILERITMRHPDLIIKFGGHAMAAGLSIIENRFNEFQHAFNQTVQEFLTASLQDIIWTDGELSPEQLDLNTAELIRQAGPWGQAFPEPIFEGKFNVLQQRLVGERHLKMLLEPMPSGPLLDAIAFNIDRAYYPDLSIKRVHIAYKLDVNEYRANRSLQLLVEYIQPLV